MMHDSFSSILTLALIQGSDSLLRDRRESNPASLLEEYPPGVRLRSAHRIFRPLLRPGLLGIRHSDILWDSSSDASHRQAQG